MDGIFLSENSDDTKCHIDLSFDLVQHKWYQKDCNCTRRKGKLRPELLLSLLKLITDL